MLDPEGKYHKQMGFILKKIREQEQYKLSGDPGVIFEIREGLNEFNEPSSLDQINILSKLVEYKAIKEIKPSKTIQEKIKLSKLPSGAWKYFSIIEPKFGELYQQYTKPFPSYHERLISERLKNAKPIDEFYGVLEASNFDNSKIEIIIDKKMGIYKKIDDTKRYEIEIDSFRFKYILKLLEGSMRSEELLALGGQKAETVSKAISKINKLFIKNLQVEENLIVQSNTSGYNLNNKIYTFSLRS